jgi:3',5'-cyclic-AMP phosphodiesterase
MPIHLAPISRRRFLAKSLLAGSAFFAAPHLFAVSRRRTDRSYWALLSDTHVAGDRARVLRNTNMARNLEMVVVDLLSLPERPAGVFITGDCALNTGEAEDYETLVELLQPLKHDRMDVWLALGNHDNRERFRAGVPERRTAKQPVAEKHVALVKTPDVNWFMLDSLEATNSTPGLLGSDQLSWLARTLDDNERKPAIILVHHNPAMEVSTGALKDTTALLEILRPRRQVKAYVYGHTHRWNVQRDSSGIHLVNLPPTAYVFREGDPAGWVKTTIQKNGMRLELRCVEAQHPAHSQVHQLDWRR